MNPTAGTRRRRFTVRLIAVNLLLVCVLFEIACLIYVYFRKGEVLYVRQPLTVKPGADPGTAQGRLHETVVERLHPFFGYIQLPHPDSRPGFSCNQFGFVSPHEYPYTSEHDDEFVVGVFGGSVASNYSIFVIQQAEFGEHLKGMPGYEDAEPIFLSFAAGGYKQPQQLLILSYMLSIGQQFDLVVNIDGFNEVALSYLNNKRQIDLTMPSVQHVSPLTSIGDNRLSERLPALFLNMANTKRALVRANSVRRKARLASVYMLASTYALIQRRRIRKMTVEVDQISTGRNARPESSVYYYYTRDAVLPDEQYATEVARHWATSSVLMHRLLASHGIPYVHVLQPNQYFKTGRTYGHEERAIAFDPKSPYEKGVEIGYPALIEQLSSLRSEGVEVVDGTGIFDRIRAPVYKDTCCHYTIEGQTVLSSFVAESITGVLVEPPRGRVTRARAP